MSDWPTSHTGFKNDHWSIERTIIHTVVPFIDDGPQRVEAAPKEYSHRERTVEGEMHLTSPLAC